MDENDRRECLKKLAARMRIQAVPDAVANELPEDTIWMAYYPDDEDYWKELEEETQRLLRVYRAAPGSVTPPGRGDSEARGAPPQIEVQLSEYTCRRGEVFAELIGLDPEVREFRYRLRKLDPPLSPEEEVAYEGAELPLSREEADAFKVVFSASPGKLEKLSERLAWRYGWYKDEAQRFVLTGEAPRPVRVERYDAPSTNSDIPGTSRIVVTADAWVFPEEVADAFRTAQRRILGHDVRKLSDKVLEVGRFVAQQTGVNPTHPSWPDIHRRWNSAYPDEKWGYKSYRGLRQAFMRLMHPNYRRPPWKGRDSS